MTNATEEGRLTNVTMHDHTHEFIQNAWQNLSMAREIFNMLPELKVQDMS